MISRLTILLVALSLVAGCSSGSGGTGGGSGGGTAGGSGGGMAGGSGGGTAAGAGGGTAGGAGGGTAGGAGGGTAGGAGGGTAGGAGGGSAGGAGGAGGSGDLTCSGVPLPTTATATVTLTGTVIAAGISSAPLSGATVTAFTTSGTMLGTTTSATGGAFSLTVSTGGTPLDAFVKVTASQKVETDWYPAVPLVGNRSTGEINVFGSGTLTLLAGVAGITLDPNASQAFFTVDDCSGMPINGATVSSTPAAGTWRVAGQPVLPGRLAMPCFVAIPGRDRIVPPDSALALAAMIPGAVVHRPASGHIGMAAGPRAEAALWSPLLDWLQTV